MSSIFSTVPPFSLRMWFARLCQQSSFQTILYWLHGPQIFPNALFLCFFMFPSFAGREGGQLWRILSPVRIGAEVAHSMPLLSLFLSPLSFLESALHKYPPLPQFCLQRDGEKGVVCIQRIRHVCQNGLPPTHRNGPFCQDFTLTKMATFPSSSSIQASKKHLSKSKRSSPEAYHCPDGGNINNLPLPPGYCSLECSPLYPRLSEGA